MSKNRKNKKNTRSSKNFKIENLEPRLLMDADVDSWLDDVSSFTSINTNNVDEWKNGVLTGVSYTDPSDTSGVRTVATVGNFINNDVDSSDYNEIKNKISGYYSKALNQLKNEKNKNAANLSVSKDEIYKKILTLIAAEKATSSTPSSSSYNWFTTTSTSLNVDEFEVKGWVVSLSKGTDDSIIFSVNKSKKFDENIYTSHYKDYFSADVSQLAQANVELVDSSLIGDSGYTASFKIRLDTIKGNDYVVAEKYDAHMDFKQACGKEATYGLLKLKSVADAVAADEVFEPDFVSGVRNSGSSRNEEYYKADLNFELADDWVRDANLTKDLTYSASYNVLGETNASWNWGSNDNEMVLFNHVYMGNILGKLSSLSSWLSNVSVQTIENPDPLLKENFGGLLSQNVEENLNLPELLKSILDKHPQTLNDLCNIRGFNAVVDTKKVVSIHFSLKLNELKQNVSIVKDELELLGFKFDSNDSLSCESEKPELTFDLCVDLKNSVVAGSSNNLEEIGLNYLETFGSSIVKAQSPIAYDNTQYSSDLSNLKSKKVFDYYYDSRRGTYLLLSSRDAGSPFTSDNKLSELGRESDSLKMGFIYKFPFSGSWTNNQTIKVTIDKDEKKVYVKKGEDFYALASSINAAFADTLKEPARVFCDNTSYSSVLVIEASSNVSITVNGSTFNFQPQYFIESNAVPVSTPKNDIGFTIKVKDSSASLILDETVSINKDMFYGVKCYADVANVINAELKTSSISSQPGKYLSDYIVVEVCDDRLTFRTKGAFSADDLNVTFVDSYSQNYLGFGSLSNDGDGSSIEIKVKPDSNSKTLTVNLDLRDFAKKLYGSNKLSSCIINDLLDQIVLEANRLLKKQFPLANVSLKNDNGTIKIYNSPYQLVSIKDLNGFSLASMLGIAGEADDLFLFKQNATLLSVVENAVSFKNLKLVIKQKLSGQVNAKASIGCVETDIGSETIDITNEKILELNGQLPKAQNLSQKGVVEQNNRLLAESLNAVVSLVNSMPSSPDSKLVSELLLKLESLVTSCQKYRDAISLLEQDINCGLNSVIDLTLLNSLIGDIKSGIVDSVNILSVVESYDVILNNILNDNESKSAALYSIATSNCTVTNNYSSTKTGPVALKILQKGTQNSLGSFELLPQITTLTSKKLTPSNVWNCGSNDLVDAAKLQALASLDMGKLTDGVARKLKKDLLEGSYLDVINAKLPFFGKSLSEFLGIYLKLRDFFNCFNSAKLGSLQELCDYVYRKTGANVNFTLDYNTSKTIAFNISWEYKIIAQKLELGNLAPEGSDFYFGGGVEAYLNGFIKFNIGLVVDCDNYTVQLTCADSSKPMISCELSIDKDNLSGDLSVGFQSLVVPLVRVGRDSNGNQSSIHTKVTLDVDKNLSLTSSFNAKALLYLSTLAGDAGVVKIGDELGNNFSTSSLNLSIPMKLVPPSSLSSLAWDTGAGPYLTFDFSQLKTDFSSVSLFDKIALVANGLSDVLRRAQSGINKSVLSKTLRSMPLIGDSIVNVADCLSSLDELVVEPFRKFVTNAQGLNAKNIAEYLLKTIGKNNLLLDIGLATDASPQRWAGKEFRQSLGNKIQYYEIKDPSGNVIEVGWRLKLGNSYSLSKDASFDLGFPGLGMTSEGGLELGLEWGFEFGFGISVKDGAFLLLSNGSEDPTARSESLYKPEYSGDDLHFVISVNPKNGSTIKGNLGFLDMEAVCKQNVQNKLAFLSIDVDLNDGGSGDDSLGKDWVSDGTNNKSIISFGSLGSNLSVETSINASVDFELGLKLTAGNDFPSISSDFVFKWTADKAHITGSVNEVGFKNIVFDAGEFIDNLLMPMVDKIKMVLEPIQPLLDFLQSEIPVLNKLPAGKFKMTVLDLIKLYGESKNMKFDFLDDVIQLNSLAKKISKTGNKGLKLPDLSLVDLSTNDSNQSKMNRKGLDFLQGAVTNIDDWLVEVKNLFSWKNSRIGSMELNAGKWIVAQGKDYLSEVTATTKEFNGGKSASSSGNYGWSFPIFNNTISEVMGLMFGRQAVLVKYHMRPLEFNFDWSKSFAIVGPLFADIGFNFGVCIDLSFGYDTLGLVNWKKSGFKNAAALLDGFFIGDWNDEGQDVAEVVFHSGVVAGASVGGIAGIDVALNLNVNLDFSDPNNDGKIRYYELLQNFKQSPLTIFDTSATIEVKAYAYLNYLFGKKEWTLWSSGAMDLFKKAPAVKEVQVYSKNGNDIIVNVGRFAASRNEGNLNDLADEVVVTMSTQNSGNIKITYGGATEDKDFSLSDNGTIYVYAGEYKDKISVKYDANCTDEVKINFVFEGDNDDDEIDLSTISLAEGCFAVLMGNAGSDIIKGASGSGVNFIFGDMGYVAYDDESKKKVSFVETVHDEDAVGDDKLYGGNGKNYIFGGDGSDWIYGGCSTTEKNYLFGDFGKFVVDADEASRYDLFDEGGDDIIYGGIGEDVIYGGAGMDRIDGGASSDEIHGGKGNDVIYGGSGDDHIYGDDGVDLIFGDRLTVDSMVISEKNGSASSQSVCDLPYAFLSNQLKGDNDSPLVAYRNVAGNSGNASNSGKLYINELSDTIVNGDDEIYGGFGSDIIYGDDGLNALASSNKGNDKIYGEGDDDFIDGDGGSDVIEGGLGNDIIYGGRGDDILDGQSGDDIVFGDDGLVAISKGSANGSLFKKESEYDLSSLNANMQEQKNVFGSTINPFVNNFEIYSNASSNLVGGKDVIFAGQGSDIVDGQAGDDTYHVKFRGEGNLGYTNILETGSDNADVLKIDATAKNDELLIRASDKGLGSVMLLPEVKDNVDDYADQDKSQIERVNFWKNSIDGSGLENISLNAGAGDDTIAVDGTLSTISIDAGAGDDSISIGQMFESNRNNINNANVASVDAFGKNTTKTSRGYVSAGVQHATSIEGGDGNDTFTLLHTSAPLAMQGGAGDDVFNIQLLQKLNAAGEIDGTLMNAPVSVIGGVGSDTLNMAGSEGDDTFVITEDGLQSSGVSIQSVSIENNNVSGGAGDDSFYVLSSKQGTSYYLEGNEGNDSFYNGGSQTDERYIQVENMDYRGHNGIIEHSVTTDVDAYKNAVAGAISVNIIDQNSSVIDVLFLNKSGQIVDPSSIIMENGTSCELYKVALSSELKDGETVVVTIFAPIVSDETKARGGQGVLLSKDQVTFASSVKIVLDSSNWKNGVSVFAKAPKDSLKEGSDYIALLHSAEIQGSTKSVNLVRNTLHFVKNVGGAMNVNTPFIDTEKQKSVASLTLENDCVIQLAYAVNVPNATTLELDGVVIKRYDSSSSASTGLFYQISGTQLIICNKDGRPQSVSGTLKFNGTISYTNIVDEVTPVVSSTTSTSATVGSVVIEHTDGSTDVIEPAAKTGTPIHDDFYTITLSGPALVGDETVTVNIDPVKTPFEPNSDAVMSQVKISRITDENDADICDADGNQISDLSKITFDANSFINGSCRKYRVYVEALYDEVHESDGLSLIALGANTIEHIKGEISEDGAGKGIDIDFSNPLMVRYGMGVVTELSFSETDKTTDERNVASAKDSALFEKIKKETVDIDENASVDRVFINNMDNARNADNSLKALEKTSAKNQNDPKDSVVRLLDSDKHALQFDHKDENANLNNQFKFANMEYAETNLGSGSDKVDIYKTVYREDNFQTFTVFNTGSGKSETVGKAKTDDVFDDDITVHSYVEEKTLELAKMSGVTSAKYTGNVTNAAQYTMVGLTSGDSIYVKKLFEQFKKDNADASANNREKVYRVFLNVEYNDGSIQRREIVIDEFDYDAKKLVLNRALTTLENIKTATLTYNHDGDGMLVVNAQGGDDKIVAEADDGTEISRKDMVLIGGSGADTIDVQTNAIAFGDRGQIVFENDKGDFVTILGSLTPTLNTDASSSLDYTTPAKKSESNYFQTDGVVRDPKYIHSVSEAVDGYDRITTHGDNNVVIGGAGEDVIHLEGDNNVAIGDNGEVKFANGDKVTGNGKGITHVYGDSTKSYVNYVQTTADTIGAKDIITTDNGKNVVMGGKDSDIISTGLGNDIIVGDGGETYVDENREALLVSNAGRNLDGKSAGSDVIKSLGGDNVVFAGLNSISRTQDFKVTSEGKASNIDISTVVESNVDLVVTGDGEDTIFGDNGYATFKGNHKLADNGFEITDSATLSFNFQGAAQQGLNSEETAGAANAVVGNENVDYSAKNWNNIAGSLSGTYGNDDKELVYFDDGTRASAVSVSYGGHEIHRYTATDKSINLQAYTLGLNGVESDSNKKLMNSGLMTSAPGNQCDNRLDVTVDGLAQYFVSYDVIVYLDVPDSHSAQYQSVRKVSLYIDGVEVDAYYVNDMEEYNYGEKNGNPGLIQATTWAYKEVGSGESKTRKAVELDDVSVKDVTYGNYVVFRVASASDRIEIRITDGYTEDSINGKDLPGIAGIQIKGQLHAQDVASSTDINLGGDDDIRTLGGDDIVVGGAGSDKIVTYGDERYGLYDNDIVFGDDAWYIKADRDGDASTATTITKASSIAATDMTKTYDDVISTGDGNDVVVGGIGADRIFSGDVKSVSLEGYDKPITEPKHDDVKVDDSALDNLKTIGFNFTGSDVDASGKAANGDAAGVVETTNWHDVYRSEYGFLVADGNLPTQPVMPQSPDRSDDTETYNWAMSKYQEDMRKYNEDVQKYNRLLDTLARTPADSSEFSTVEGVGVKLYAVENGYINSTAAMKILDDQSLDGDTSNSKLYNSYLAAQQSDELILKLTGLSTYRGNDNASCDVYVYIGGDDKDSTGSYNYVYQIWSEARDGYAGETRYLNDWRGNNFDGDYREADCMDADVVADTLRNGITPDIRLIGNYVVLRNVTCDELTVHLRSLYIQGSQQSPKHLPVISAVQIVANKTTSVSKEIAIGGDHDKDLVFGDDAYLEFDLDIPFAVNEDISEYKNRVITAKSKDISLADAQKIDTHDVIVTGKDRDVVVGGEGADVIRSGAADDVVLGDNAELLLEHNNPIGVFTPSVENTLEEHDYKQSDEKYLGADNVTVQDIENKYNQGLWNPQNNNGITGIKDTSKDETGRKDDIVDTEGSNLLIEGKYGDGDLLKPEVTVPEVTVPEVQPGETQQGEVQPSETQPGEGSLDGVILCDQSVNVLYLSKGETVKCLFTNYELNGQQMRIAFTSDYTQPHISIDVELEGILSGHVDGMYYADMMICAEPNGENGFVVCLTALEDVQVIVSVRQ